MPPVKRRGVAKPKNAKKTILRLLKYIGESKALLGVVFLAVIASSGASIVGDSMIKPFINDYILPLAARASSGETIGFADFIPLLKFLAVMAGAFLFGAFATWLNSRIMVHVSSRTLCRIRTDLFTHMETLPLRFFDSHTHGDLMSLYTNDTDTLRDMMSQSLPQLLSCAVSVTGIFVMMIITSPLLTFIIVFTILFMLFVIGNVGKLSAKSFREQQASIGKLNGYIEEMIEGQRVVKVFNHEKKSMDDFVVLNDALCKAGTRANTYGSILMPIMGNLSHIQYGIIAVAGAFRVVSGHMDLGSLAAFMQYTRNFSRPVTMISQQFNSILNALAGAERIFAVIDEESEIDDGKVRLVNAMETSPASSADGKPHLVQTFARTGDWAWHLPKSLPVPADSVSDDVQSFADDDDYTLVKLCGDVNFENVTFSYVPEKEVLHSISLHAKPGEKIALVGSTGSGKTTITNLLTRFYDIDDDKGSITYDGIALKNISKDDLRRSLGMVLQDTHLFTGTIRDNIKYGNLEASEAQILEAAKLANADTFITHLEKGYDTVITGDGGNLSQGQRQLLAIARAAVANPPVLILDEATSSIDTRTEALIEKGMDRLMEGRTVFVIAHRLSTVRNADEIVVLEKGVIVERGNHDALMQKQGRYYKLYTGAFELN